MGNVNLIHSRLGLWHLVEKEARESLAGYDPEDRSVRDYMKGDFGDELLPPKRPRRAKDRYVSSVRSLT